MLYPMPKKIQLALSQAKWQLAAENSVLVLVGLQNLRMQAGIQDTDLMANLIQISNKAVIPPFLIELMGRKSKALVIV